jgi:hypothetical protein
MAHFLVIVDAPEGEKPHPLDTHLIALPEGVNPYRLLAVACRFANEGGDMIVPEGDDAATFSILTARFEQLAGHFDRDREHDRAREALRP